MRWLYPIAMLGALGAAAWLLRKSQRDLSLSASEKFGIGLGGLVGATFAAKLPFLLAGAATHGPLGTWLADGKTILWGLAGGYAGVEIAKWSLRIQQRTGDTFVIAVAVAVAIGRLGCFANGCCYGCPTHVFWGIRFADTPDQGDLLRHPTQLYEMLFHGCFAMVAWWGIRRGMFKSKWMLIYLVAYCVYRFGSEFLRPEPMFVWGMTFYQLSSIGLGFLFAIVLWRRGLRPTLD